MSDEVLSVTIFMKKGDTTSSITAAPIRWRDAFPGGQEDEIRHVRCRLRERELARENPDFPKWRIGGSCSEAQYRAWLLGNEGYSFQEIGDFLFANDATPEGRKSKAARYCQCVEKELSGTRKRLTPTPGQVSALVIRQ